MVSWLALAFNIEWTHCFNLGNYGPVCACVFLLKKVSFMLQIINTESLDTLSISCLSTVSQSLAQQSLAQQWLAKKGWLPGSCGQHFGVGTEVAEADRSIITDLTAEVVEILEKSSRKTSIMQWNSPIRWLFEVWIRSNSTSPSGSCAAPAVWSPWLNLKRPSAPERPPTASSP